MPASRMPGIGGHQASVPEPMITWSTRSEPFSHSRQVGSVKRTVFGTQITPGSAAIARS